MSDEARPWYAGFRWPVLLIAGAVMLITYLTFPLLDGIVLGMVFAYVGRPIRDRFKNRKRLGSVVATVSIVVPISVIMGLGTIEIANQFLWLAQHQGDIFEVVSAFVANIEIPPIIYDELTGSLRNIIGIFTGIIGNFPVFNLGKVLTLGIINFILSMPVCYFLLLDGEGFAESLITTLAPEKREIHRRYFSRIDRLLSGIFLGSIYTAIVGGIISAFVFYAFGVPRPFAMASFVFIAGMVPILTAWIVIVPITAYRFFIMGPIEALTFFAVASVLIYLPTELVIRPYLVSARTTIHPLLVMVSFLGGMLVAGIGGFFLAPAIMGVLVGVYQVRREQVLSGSEIPSVGENEAGTEIASGSEIAPGSETVSGKERPPVKEAPDRDDTTIGSVAR